MKRKLQFVFADEFLEIFSAFRVVKISGRFGGGKTHFGFALAAWLLSTGRVNHVFTNVPCVFSTPAFSPAVDLAILLDESWQYLEGREDVMSYAAFLRKFNHYLILPTVFPIHRRLDFLNVQRVFNAQIVGLPLWIYRWSLSMGKIRESGIFGVYNPGALYGLYDTEYVPTDDGGISAALLDGLASKGWKKRNRYADLFDRARALGSPVEGVADKDVVRYAAIEEEIRQAVDEVGDISGEISEGVNEIHTLQGKIRRSIKS